MIISGVADFLGGSVDLSSSLLQYQNRLVSERKQGQVTATALATVGIAGAGLLAYRGVQAASMIRQSGFATLYQVAKKQVPQELANLTTSAKTLGLKGDTISTIPSTVYKQFTHQRTAEGSIALTSRVRDVAMSEISKASNINRSMDIAIGKQNFKMHTDVGNRGLLNQFKHTFPKAYETEYKKGYKEAEEKTPSIVLKPKEREYVQHSYEKLEHSVKTLDDREVFKSMGQELGAKVLTYKELIPHTQYLRKMGSGTSLAFEQAVFENAREIRSKILYKASPTTRPVLQEADKNFKLKIELENVMNKVKSVTDFQDKLITDIDMQRVSENVLSQSMKVKLKKGETRQDVMSKFLTDVQIKTVFSGGESSDPNVVLSKLRGISRNLIHTGVKSNPNLDSTISLVKNIKQVTPRVVSGGKFTERSLGLVKTAGLFGAFPHGLATAGILEVGEPIVRKVLKVASRGMLTNRNKAIIDKLISEARKK